MVLVPQEGDPWARVLWCPGSCLLPQAWPSPRPPPQSQHHLCTRISPSVCVGDRTQTILGAETGEETLKDSGQTCHLELQAAAGPWRHTVAAAGGRELGAAGMSLPGLVKEVTSMQ